MLSCYAAAGTTRHGPQQQEVGEWRVAGPWQHFFNGSFAIKLPLNL